MKYFVLFCAGMADRKTAGNTEKTPLEAASKPTMNMLSYRSFNGLVKYAGDDASVEQACASVLGYDADAFKAGSLPANAISHGVKLDAEDTVYGFDFVSLSARGKLSSRTLLSAAGDTLSKAETAELIKALNAGLSTKIKKFRAGEDGSGYLVWKRAPRNFKPTATEDVIGKKLDAYLPSGASEAKYLPIFEKSFEILSDHPINEKRRKAGLKPVNCIWLRSESKLPDIEPFAGLRDVSCAVVAPSGAMGGVAVCAGMKQIKAEGYAGKAAGAVDAFKDGTDFVLVCCDEAAKSGLDGDHDAKVKAIEACDTEILAPVYEYLCGCGDQFKIMTVTEMPAVCREKSYAAEPVPFFIYSSQRQEVGYKPFTETNAAKSGFYLPEGVKMMNFLIRNTAQKETTEEVAG